MLQTRLQVELYILTNRTNHWMQYFLTKAAGESTVLLLTSQISDIAANRYPIDILCKLHKHIFNMHIFFKKMNLDVYL